MMVRGETNWLMPEDYDDGAEYVRPGMRPPTDWEIDAAGLSSGATNDAIIEKMMATLQALLDGDAAEAAELPGCQQSNPPAKRNDDIEARAPAADRRRKQRRRSRNADARLVEAKRAKEAASGDHHSSAVGGAAGRHVGVLPIENEEYEVISSTPTPSSSTSTSSTPTVSPTSSGPASDEEGMAVSDAGSTLVPWWKKEIRRSRYVNEEGVWRDNLSIKRRSTPEWRDLSDEARLDFFQDAGIKIAATLSDHALCHIVVNLAARSRNKP